MNMTQDPNTRPSLGQEIRAFLLLTAGFLPLMTVALIVVYGFGVWISQLFLGPPGH